MDHPAQHVASEAVGSEHRLRARPRLDEVEVLLVGRVGRQRIGEQRGDDDQHREADAEQDHRAACGAAPLASPPDAANGGRRHRDVVRGGAGAHETGGRRSAQGRAASNAADAWSTPRSAHRRPTICSPTGNPAAVKPAGRLAAGCPVKLNG